MSHEVKLHPAQTHILRELLFHPSAGYGTLQKPTGLTSDHFNFHISRLVELDFVDKVSRGKYRLSPTGKEYANRLDTDDNTIERQPKVAVLLGIERQNSQGKKEYLFQERLKNPWYGFWGIPSGKIRWGETIPEAAARELYEETRLTADISYAGIYHEHTLLDDATLPQEDKIFFVMHCRHPKGKLMKEFEGGRNAWFTAQEAKKLKPRFMSFDLELDILLGKHDFIEQQHRYQSDVF
ncbi:MAG TPA: NUDIX domain-containing protein [Candidatus Saccharimonadales bacterium]|jgi:ADP-ribose pyrophosphatase YjhB (NUDIX family)